MESVHGYLEVLEKGFGFLRDIEQNFAATSKDTFVPAFLIKKNRLKGGAFVQGMGEKGPPGKKNLKLATVEKINHLPVESHAALSDWEQLVSINPCERFVMRQQSDDRMGTALDMLVPMGKGQRGLVISPPKSGKTTILQHIARSVLQNHPDTIVFVLLVDERPEEVTDFKRGLKGAHVLYSSADQSVEKHLHITGFAMNAAIRHAAAKKDVVVLIDSLTRLSRAFNNDSQSYGRTLSGGLGANAMQLPRKIFGSARNIENGGSLTIIASILVDTGSRMDDVIFQEFKGTGNMDLRLSRKCAEQRLWPAIHINQSGTRKENLLLDDQAYEEAIAVRRALARMDEVGAMAAFQELLDQKCN